jgi:uncharacterized membrane protein
MGCNGWMGEGIDGFAFVFVFTLCCAIFPFLSLQLCFLHILMLSPVSTAVAFLLAAWVCIFVFWGRGKEVVGCTCDVVRINESVYSRYDGPSNGRGGGGL